MRITIPFEIVVPDCKDPEQLVHMVNYTLDHYAEIELSIQALREHIYAIYDDKKRIEMLELIGVLIGLAERAEQ